MKNLLSIGLVLLMLLGLIGCKGGYQKLDYKFGDYQVYLLPNGNCEMFIMDRIYEDNQSIYYLTSSGCSAGYYYFIYVNDEYINIKKAITDEIITIEDVIESNVPFLMIEEKTE